MHPPYLPGMIRGVPLKQNKKEKRRQNGGRGRGEGEGERERKERDKMERKTDERKKYIGYRYSGAIRRRESNVPFIQRRYTSPLR